MRIEVLDHGYVELVESWGSDERIIEAARMSTNKGFQGWGRECNNCQDQCLPYGDIDCSACNNRGKVTGDEKLLRYLYTHKHMTPFEMAGMIIEVQAPIMVFREWHRHRTQSYNEMSGRYTELPDLFYIPSVERLMNSKQSATNKQSSSSGIPLELAKGIQEVLQQNSNYARTTYEHLLESGVSREIARLALPVNQYSRMRASANLRNWLGFLALRMDASAQWEIREYANALHTLLSKCFPRTVSLFDEGK